MFAVCDAETIVIGISNSLSFLSKAFQLFFSISLHNTQQISVN